MDQCKSLAVCSQFAFHLDYYELLLMNTSVLSAFYETRPSLEKETETDVHKWWNSVPVDQEYTNQALRITRYQ